MGLIERMTLEIKTSVAERLSHVLTDLQHDYGLTFDEAVAVLRSALENAHSDSDMPGGGYIVIP